MEWDKITQERDRLRATVSSLQAEIDGLVLENMRLKGSLEQKVRVFLPVIVAGNKKLTVDPETGAVIETKLIQNRRLICVDGGVACYYDKPVYGGVQLLAERQPNYGAPVAQGLGGPGGSQAKPADNTSPGAFVDASIVPEPEPIKKVTW